MNPSTALATVLVDELIAQGVREAVLSPGSRNAPLAYALHAADAADRLRLHVRIDERSAGFLAIGLAKADDVRRPVVVVTTSGTATANLVPAVLEASHAGVPLIILTADRPAELRGVGANQTTDQAHLYGSAVRWFADVPAAEHRTGQVAYWRDLVLRAATAATGTISRHPGPVHLNVAMREPLVPGPDSNRDWVEPLGPSRGRVAERRAHPEPTFLTNGPRTVVVAGDDPTGRRGGDARSLAETAGWPLLAEPSSGARSGPNAIGTYRLLLDVPGLGDQIERAVVFGHPTLSRPVSALLARPDVEVVVVTDRPDWPDPARQAKRIVSSVAADADAAAPSLWLQAWQTADKAAAAAVDEVLAAEPSLNGPAVAKQLAASLQPGDQLFVGSSSPVRDLDLAARPFEYAEVGPVVHANRGLSGIDGCVSTAVGAALAHQGTGRSYAILGDITFVHDSNGLAIGPGEPRPDLTIVVVNDDGGGLFTLLEQGAPEGSGTFERLFGTPHDTDLAKLCAAMNAAYERAESDAELAQALRRDPRGLEVIEVPIDRSRTRDLHARLRTAVLAAQSAKPTSLGTAPI